jgi:hypothetical protein
MPYTPHLPPPVTEFGAPPDAFGGSPIPEKPVTPVTRLLQMTLKEFELGGRLVQVRVPWLPETLWFVSGERQVETLIRRGISRGRIWTARELMFLWTTRPLDQQTAERIGHIKAELGGEITSVEAPER